MIKHLLAFLITLLLFTSAEAQKGGIVYYLTNSGKLVSAKDSADYWMVVSPPDTTISKYWYLVREYNKSGTLRLQTTSKTNDLNLNYHGKYTAYYPDGRKMRTGEYVDGKFKGLETNYYPNGNLYNTKNYNEDGTVAFVGESDSTGHVLSEYGTGTWIEYDAPFKNVVVTGSIKNGVMNGKWTGKINDTLDFINIYLNGILKVHQEISHRQDDTRSLPEEPIHTNQPADVFAKVDKFPSFRGGIQKLYEYFSKHIQYPVEARMRSQQGKVVVSFVVEKDGTLSNFEISRHVSPLLDAEALRVMKLSPKWDPGYKNGQPVRTAYSVPLSFALSE